MSVVIPSLRAAIAVPPWVKNELWRRARAVPSLDQRFAESKSLVDAVSGQQLITFTRASSGTVTDSAGVIQTAATDVPRFDHNPTTGESLGLLVEEQRVNLLLRSEEFDNGYWSKSGSTITANTVLAPDGTLTADTHTHTGASPRMSAFSAASIPANTPFTFSFFAKAGTASFAAVTLYEPGVALGRRFWWNISNGSTGTIGSIGAGYQNATSSIISYGNGWYRCIATMTNGSNTTVTIDGLQVCLDTDGQLNPTVSGIFGHLWGAQLEAGGTPSSYIPTTTAAVTRSASVADVINQAIANNIRTLYLEFRSPASGTRGVASLNDNTANERASVLTSGTDPRLVVVDGGVEQANVNGGTVTANQRTRIAMRINANDFAISINGGAVVTDTSGTLPTVDRLMLGRTQAGEYLNGTLARVTGWTQLLPDSTMQSLAQ